jgi:hypothetical protein
VTGPERVRVGLDADPIHRLGGQSSSPAIAARRLDRLVGVLRCRRGSVQHPRNKLDRDTLVEQIRHAVHEDRSWLAPARRYRQGFGGDG